MTKNDLKIIPLTNKKETPFELLLIADPSQDAIEKYIWESDVFLLKSGSEVIGVIAVLELTNSELEIKNVAIKEDFQAKGFGKDLIRSICKLYAEKGAKKIKIGTGNSSIHQLGLYQKLGFEITSVDKDFFLREYEEDIFENGIQCKDMIYLSKNLNDAKHDQLERLSF
jgi:ribosomal protein S18 acetylase RimI-like enzyme